MPSQKPNRIAEIRKFLKLSQAELGELIGAHYVTVSKLENGKLPLTAEWLSRISSALRVDPSEVIDDDVKRIIHISGAIGGKARVDMWERRVVKQNLSFEVDVYSGGFPRSQWLVVIGDALYPIFQHLDVLRISYEPDKNFLDLQGNLCAIELDETDLGPVVVLGILTFNYGDDIFDIHMLNGPTRQRAKIFNAARVTLALFHPPIDVEAIEAAADNFIDIPGSEAHFSNLAEWLKKA